MSRKSLNYTTWSKVRWPMRKSCKRNERIGISWKVKKRTRIQGYCDARNGWRSLSSVCQPSTGRDVKTYFSIHRFIPEYLWLSWQPEYFELSKVTGEIIFSSESVSKAEKYVLYKQERDDPLSLHENDSEIEFTDQAPTWEQLYKEIETSRAIEFNIITPWSSKDVL